MEPSSINCAEACVNGCILGDKCPNREYIPATEDFISNTSLDQMLEMADEAIRKKRMQPPTWVLPDLPD
jgi:hypothetical protein